MIARCMCVCVYAWVGMCVFCPLEYVSKCEDCLKCMKHSTSSKTFCTLLYCLHSGRGSYERNAIP